MQTESVKIQKVFVDMLRESKKETRVPIGAAIEVALIAYYGEPKEEKKKLKKQ